MKREYHKWYSPRLGREMELLAFGAGGRPVVVFPTSEGRFYEFEDRGIRLHVDYIRAIIHELTTRRIGIRNKYARLSDAWDFWALNPDYMPFSRKPEKKTGKTRGLLETPDSPPDKGVRR